jgi:hypothetical protein
MHINSHNKVQKLILNDLIIGSIIVKNKDMNDAPVANIKFIFVELSSPDHI